MKKLGLILLVTGVLVTGLVFASGCAGFAGSKNTASDASGDMAGFSPLVNDKDPAASTGDSEPGGTEESWDLALSYRETENHKIDCDKSEEVERLVDRHDQEKTIAITINAPVKLLHTVDSDNRHWYGAADMDPAQEIAAAARYSVVDRSRYYVYLRGDLYSNSYEMDYTESALLDSMGITVDLGPEETSGFVQVWGDATGSKTGKQRTFWYPEGWTDYEPISEKVDQNLLAMCEAGPDTSSGTGNSVYTVNDSGFFLTCMEKTTSNFDDCTTNRIDRQMFATFTPHTKKSLKAIPGGPYTVLRGTPLLLDGSRSKGSVTAYTWTFAPGEDCPAGLSPADVRLNGFVQTVTFLCNTTATLEVTDGTSSDSASVPVTVMPRSWDTPFTLSEEGIDRMSRPPWLDFGSFEGGANICGPCEGTGGESSTILHPAPVSGSWESRGYQLGQVSEPGKPFNGIWYVSAYSMVMNRKTVINPYILPKGSGGRDLPANMGSFYQKNLDGGFDITGYLAGIREHEEEHAQRMLTALRKQDPAQELENLTARDKDTLRTIADTVLNGTQVRICKRSSDASQPPMAVTWSGKLLFPMSDTNQWKEGETSVGGYRQDAGESCG